MATSQVTQRQSVAFRGTVQLLQYYLHQLSGDVEKLEEKQGFTVFKVINIFFELGMVVIEVMQSKTFK